MGKLPFYIRKLRNHYIETKKAKTFKEINCGDCVDFAEEIEFLFPKSEALSNDHFVCEQEGSDGWDGDDSDQWSEKWLTEYNSLPPAGITIADLTHKIGGYHCWIYSEDKHYDAECPEGVENFFDLPFFKRHLESDE